MNTSNALTKIPYFIADPSGKYLARSALTEAQIIKAAKALLDKQIIHSHAVTSPDITRVWLQTHYRDLEHEVFICLFLDNQHCIKTAEELSRGTIDSSSVYPREVVKRALQLNAAAVIFAHNHPSGITEPSPGDKHLTDKLQQALALVDIRVLGSFYYWER